MYVKMKKGDEKPLDDTKTEPGLHTDVIIGTLWSNVEGALNHALLSISGTTYM